MGIEGIYVNLDINILFPYVMKPPDRDALLSEPYFPLAKRKVALVQSQKSIPLVSNNPKL